MADLFRAIKLKSYQVQMVVKGLSLRFFPSFEKISPTLNFELKKIRFFFITRVYQEKKKSKNFNSTFNRLFIVRR